MHPLLSANILNEVCCLSCFSTNSLITCLLYDRPSFARQVSLQISCLATHWVTIRLLPQLVFALPYSPLYLDLPDHCLISITLHISSTSFTFLSDHSLLTNFASLQCRLNINLLAWTQLAFHIPYSLLNSHTIIILIQPRWCTSISFPLSQQTIAHQFLDNDSLLTHHNFQVYRVRFLWLYLLSLRPQASHLGLDYGQTQSLSCKLPTPIAKTNLDYVRSFT